MDQFFEKKQCDRCGKNLDVRIMSIFNTETICIACSDKEKAHPDYKKAKEAERLAVLSGNRYFAGIGKPADL